MAVFALLEDALAFGALPIAPTAELTMSPPTSIDVAPSVSPCHGSNLVVCFCALIPQSHSPTESMFEPSNRGSLLCQLRHQRPKRTTISQPLLELHLCQGQQR